MFTEQTKQLAQRVVASHNYFEKKETLLKWLLDGKDEIVVEAELDLHETLFLGFRSDQSAPLTSASVITVTPREVPLEATRYTEVIKVYRHLNQLKMQVRKTPTYARVRFKSPWWDEYAEIVWYSFFTDMVSLRFPSSGGYKVVTRKELLSGLTEIRSA